MSLTRSEKAAACRPGEEHLDDGTQGRVQWLFVALLIAVNLPNFHYFDYFDTPNLNLIEFGERLLLSVLLAATAIALLFARPWVAWAAAWVLCLWWQPLAWAVRLISGTPVTPTLVGTAIATSPAELWNLATAISWWWYALFVLWNLACALTLRWLRQRPRWRWAWGFRGKILFFSLSLLALPQLVLRDGATKPEGPADALESTALPQTGRYEAGHPLLAFEDADRRVGSFARLPDAFPYELPWAVAQYYQGRRVIEAMQRNLRAPPPESLIQPEEARADVVVLVIGESSTRNAWHWFNPAAPATTPLLETRITRGEHLFGFKHTLAQTSATRQAVPSILTDQPLIWPNGTPNPGATRSIVSIAAGAGYATAWFSNQAAVGQHDGIIATYAGEAASTAFLNPAGFADRGALDEVLLPAVQRHLQEHRKAFVVLHTMGSHFNYRFRYPKGFGPFPQPENARDDYYNSIAYTDHILDQLIALLASDGRKSAMLYVADHGEAVPFSTCDVKPATRTTRDGYEVPALIWLSEAYAKANPDIPEILRARTEQRYTISAAPQTLADLIRGKVNATAPDLGSWTQSFLRDNEGEDGRVNDVVALWTDRFDRAVAKNPCFMLLR